MRVLKKGSMNTKTLFIIPTDAHYYKSVAMLKQFRVITLAPTCFSSCRNHHQGAVLFLAKTTGMVFSVLVVMDSVNAMAAYRHITHTCSTGRYAAIALTESISTSTEKKPYL
jgi:hypothetical protein